ncbi:DUF2513 domain-containing protein [Longimicrobium terrae]|uniref:DUF2513 domain-containing protein n=1 Tax=Longimicrobium terrae TaxID=1639882 RepID=A0A841GJ18_9BACT|nr:DUF2513 domain-containing protein [Longimicrobium terrae]MBB4634563.1 hypothetical protein [Longimicrobium terrae]MBB6068547.1 hypothetical protein [Longimicrobium terrae]NNC27735.1 DUF2513 domain-containing protein [Longimicrobium terrae]
MRRDLDLIRNLMVQMEAHPGTELRDFTAVPPDGVSQEVLDAHLRLIIESELVTGKPLETNSGLYGVFLFRITSKGHDFLELARNDTNWSRAVKELKTKALPATVGLVMDLLKKSALNAIGLSG